MDELSCLEATGKQKRADAKAAKNTPEAKAKRNSGRLQKQRGYRAEKQVEARLKQFGYKRVPLSGALGGDLSGDLRRDKPCAAGVVEVKRRAGAQKGLREMLAQGGAKVLVIVPGGGGEPLAMLELGTFELLLGEAGYGEV